MSEHEIVLGKGGGHGGGGHHGHHHGGRGWRGGGRWGGPLPFIYDVPQGIDVDDLLDLADVADEAQTQRLAKEVVKQLKGKVTVGEDLDLLDAEILGEDSGKGGGGGGGGGMFGDFGLSSIFNLAGNLAQGGLNIAAAEQAKKDAEADKARSSAQEQNKLQAAIAADVSATQAAARAAYSAQQKLASAAVDKSAADQAAAVQARAGAGLSPESTGKRVDAAQKALGAATSKAQAAPKDAYALATMNAWQQTLNKIQNVQITGPTPGDAGAGGGRGGAGKGGGGIGGWLSGKTGPVPNKVIAAGGALGAGGLLLAVLRR